MLNATTIYLLVLLIGPPASRPDVNVLYRTADKAECERQAAEWNKLGEAEKLKVICLPHKQKEFYGNNERD